MTTAAETFREIDNLAYEANRQLDIPQYDYRVVRGLLGAIKQTAQNGLRDALANQPKLEAFDELLAFTQKIAGDEHDDACEFLADEAEGCTCHVGEAKALMFIAKESRRDRTYEPHTESP